MNKRSRRLQFNLLTLLLLCTAVAVWAANWRVQQDIGRIYAELPALRNIARELVVDNPDKFAVVSPHPRWYDENRWHIWVPESLRGQPQIKLAIDGIESRQIATPVATAAIPPGKHEVEFLSEQQPDGSYLLTVLVDGKPVIEHTASKAWGDHHGSSGGNSIARLQQDLTAPIVLMQRRFHVSTGGATRTAPDGPTKGIALWIDIVATPPAPR